MRALTNQIADIFSPNDKDINDTIICEIRNSNVVIIGIYIPPENSIYYDKSYFINLELTLPSLKHKIIICGGDMNARICTANDNTEIQYINNPDTCINSNGGKLLNICNNQKITIANGTQNRVNNVIQNSLSSEENINHKTISY